VRACARITVIIIIMRAGAHVLRLYVHA